MKAVLSRSVRVVVVLTAFFTEASVLAHAQQPAKSEPADKVELRIFSLRNIVAEDLQPSITNLFERNKVRSVAQGNNLIVVANAHDLKDIQDLINTLDKEAQEPPDQRRTQTIPFKNIDNEVLENALKILPADVKFAVDPGRQVIVTGDSKALKMAADLVKNLDNPAPAVQRLEWPLRIVWLATGKLPGEAASPPEDLKNVVAELDRIGVENPRLVTQALGNISPGAELNIGGSAQLDVPYDLKIQGSLCVQSDGRPQLNISINAEVKGAKNATGKLLLNTTIVPTPGHPVVLGMTPSGQATSIFVVQLLEKQ